MAVVKGNSVRVQSIVAVAVALFYSHDTVSSGTSQRVLCDLFGEVEVDRDCTSLGQRLGSQVKEL